MTEHSVEPVRTRRWRKRTIRKLERQGVPAAAIEAAQRAGFGVPNRFIPSLDVAPYFPESVRRILRANGRTP